METSIKKFDGLSANILKYYAIIAMAIDHIAWTFVPTETLLAQIMHAIGRSTAPIMSFFIVEGFYHTKDVRKYLIRLMIFSVLSWFPYNMYQNLKVQATRKFSLIFGTQSVIYTFCLALVVLMALHSDKLRPFFKILVLLAAVYLSRNGDWGYMIIVWVLIFDRYRGDFKKTAIVFCLSSIILMTFYAGKIHNSYFRLLIDFPELINQFPIFIYQLVKRIWYQYAVILSLILLYFYNGKRSKNPNNKITKCINKWMFYAFYPLHLLVIVLLKIFII